MGVKGSADSTPCGPAIRGSYIAQKRKGKSIQNGVLMIAMGMALLFLHYCVGGDEGSNAMDFISGVLLGIIQSISLK